MPFFVDAEARRSLILFSKRKLEIAISKTMRKSFRKFTYVVYLHGIMEWVGDRVDIINHQL